MERVDRRRAVEAYISYDAAKKGKARPDTSKWNWNAADAIDTALREAGFKTGVPAGFTEWERVDLTLDDLRQCAVVDTISNELCTATRDLGTLERGGRLAGWTPRGLRPGWLPLIEAGAALPDDEPLLLRPATKSEAPARWYLEDGSGRATAMVANASKFAGSIVATAYLGVVPDPSSTFMRSRFPDLLPVS